MDRNLADLERVDIRSTIGCKILWNLSHGANLMGERLDDYTLQMDG